MRLTVGHVIRRVLVFLVTVWVAASLNFLIPRLAPGDPVSMMVGRMQLQGRSIQAGERLVEHYREMFGLDQSILVQYGKYLSATARLDMGYSLTSFPTPVMDIVGRALPWTIGLLTTTTLISFLLGTLLGALLGWRGTPRITQLLATPLIILAGIPYYLLAMLLLYVLAFQLRLFPIGGAARIGASHALSLSRIVDIVYHSILPALSVILVSVGGWMISMRGMMVTVIGSDFLTLARAKGLRRRRIFLHYALRNAILPQITGLAISVGYIVSGAVLVEVVFSYPGVGFELYRAVGNADYTVIQGITFILVLSIATAVLILDLIYPWLDPRITYAQR